MQQNPYAKKRSILDAVSFWLLSEGYFRTRKAISAHLVDTVSRHHGESRFTFTAKEDMNTPVRIYNELWAPRLKSTLEVIPPPTVGTPAQEIVKAAVDETKAIQALPLGSAWWAQCRRRALAGAGDVPEEEIDLALLILINSRGKSFCTLCGGEADGNHICLRCYKMKPNAHPSLCQCGEQRSKGRNMCNKCEVASGVLRVMDRERLENDCANSASLLTTGSGNANAEKMGSVRTVAVQERNTDKDAKTVLKQS
ncbi:hypothetical protein MHUMG1_04481 [Metarhizium humberi]|uniref:Uncharacterized protein n=2 Tax=Metarhizium TaxID=5529 RepID=A0A9P8S834_9HYPO|nr:nonribosomal peptide synthase GliP2 [Metarhizium robertsii ARSEF 23]KAH0598109.1 hypothetical protein MHUMG1_04481 [Metarhizium humberi]KHO10800.1 nonribosomal peptide synthase GliP2 [Metarhizium robertsii ARSEF 23]